tara:strand:- start:353 stop:556 length:204 start_codon:yes stop_codon:yes gene_type:complete
MLRVKLLSFNTGNEYIMDIKHDDSLENGLKKLNDFRGPDNQISCLLNEHKQVIPLNYRVKRNMTFYF